MKFAPAAAGGLLWGALALAGLQVAVPFTADLLAVTLSKSTLEGVSGLGVLVSALLAAAAVSHRKRDENGPTP